MGKRSRKRSSSRRQKRSRLSKRQRRSRVSNRQTRRRRSQTRRRSQSGGTKAEKLLLQLRKRVRTAYNNEFGRGKTDTTLKSLESLKSMEPATRLQLPFTPHSSSKEAGMVILGGIQYVAFSIDEFISAYTFITQDTQKETDDVVVNNILKLLYIRTLGFTGDNIVLDAFRTMCNYIIRNPLAELNQFTQVAAHETTPKAPKASTTPPPERSDEQEPLL